jgi:hypothetical protein
MSKNFKEFDLVKNALSDADRLVKRSGNPSPLAGEGVPAGAEIYKEGNSRLAV